MTARVRGALLGLLTFSAIATTGRAVTCGADTFIHAAQYSVPIFEPTQMVVADFNADTYPDIALLGNDYYYYATSVSILFGNADGTFLPAVKVADVDQGMSMTVGAFDAGPTVDIVVGQVNGSIAFYAGNGDGTFQSAVVSTFPGPPPAPFALAAGQFGSSPSLDLVAGDGNLTVSILIGNGDGTFAAPATFPAGTGTRSIAVGDVNGDGDLDVAATGASNAVAILLGNGNGSLGAPQLFLGGTNLNDVHLADLDGDGDLDIAVACETYAGVMLGNGNGTFQAAQKFPAGPAPRYVGIGDFDGDGVPDLAVGSRTTYGPAVVRVLLGSGNGSFLPDATYAASADLTSLVVADFGADGNVDVAGASGYENLVSVLLGNGDGSLAAVRSDALGIQPGRLAQGDFNGDGLTDLVAGGQYSVRILLATVAGGFALGQTIAIPGYFNPVAVGDFDNDGILDLLVSSFETSLYPGRGDGTFGEPIIATTSGHTGAAVVAADYNQDGNLDFAAFSDNSDQFDVVLGKGDGTFQPPQNAFTFYVTSAAIAFDVNGDETPDLVTSNGRDCCYGADTLTVLLGRGDGTFDPPVSYPAGQMPTDLTAADFTGDDVPDLVTANHDGTIAILLNNGDGTFGSPALVGLGWRPSSVVAADFDGDGNTDIVTANQESSTVTLLSGLGNGAFASPVSFVVGGNPLPALVIDVLANGTPDVVVGNTQGLGGVSLLVNTRLGVATLPPAGACEGASATLHALASGLGPLTYQWRKDGMDLGDGGNISGSTTASLTIDPASPADDGDYDVVVTDSCGSVTSKTTPFSVTLPPGQPVIGVDVAPAPGVAGMASVPDVPGDTFTWTIGGDTGAVITAGQGTSHVTFLADVPGTVMLGVTEYSSPGCGTAAAALPVPVDFFDVPPGHPFHNDIVAIAQSDITAGCGGGNYCPADPVTRAQMAVFLLKSKYGSDFQPQEFGPVFLDVPNGSFASYWINNLWQIGVTTGCGDDNYCPAASVTRAQMAVFILKTLEIYYPPPATLIFDDVPPGAFAADFIDDLYNRGITGGCSVSPPLYCPNGIVTRGQMAVFLVRAFLDPAP